MKALAPDIDRHPWAALGPKGFRDHYLKPLRPVVISGGFDHWRAAETWTPDFFRERYGGRKVMAGGKVWKLGDLIERIKISAPESPAPYLRNERLARWPKELLADIEPMPECTFPNWLDSWAFPSRRHPTYVELFVGGVGAKFPMLHFDNWHTHAFLMQLYGEKEYVALAPDQGKFLYPRAGIESNKSQIEDIDNPDLDRFPLFAHAQGIRFRLSPGETLFVPAGWWHTARITKTSITVSINSANWPNWREFTRDYCAAHAAGSSRAKTAILPTYLAVLGGVLAWF